MGDITIYFLTRTLPAGSPVRRGSPEAGLDAEELDKKTGLNQSEISTLESGQANPTYRTLQTLATALGGKIELVIR